MKIAAAVATAVATHAREAAPEECCGLLLGTADAITQAVRAHNRAADPQRRYEIDPQDHFAAIRLARARALDVVGAYHSHPRSLPIPSETDRATAFEDFMFLIAGQSEGLPSRKDLPTSLADNDVRSGLPSDAVPGGGLPDDGRSGRSFDRPFTLRAWRFRSGNFEEVPLVCLV